LTRRSAPEDNRSTLKEASVAGVNWERWARASGLGVVVLFIVAFLVLGEAPKVEDSAATIASFYDSHRGSVLTSMVIYGFALLLLLWFVGTVSNVLREAGEGRLAATALAMGATFVGLQAGTIAITGALAHSVAGEGDAGVVRAMHTLNWSVDATSAFPLAGFILAASVGLWRSATLQSWFVWPGLVVAVLVVLHGTNWATSGFWSQTGGYIFITMIAALAWLVLASVLLYLRAPGAGPASARG
jgi:hypothetical protein